MSQIQKASFNLIINKIIQNKKNEFGYLQKFEPRNIVLHASLPLSHQQQHYLQFCFTIKPLLEGEQYIFCEEDQILDDNNGADLAQSTQSQQPTVQP